MMGLVGDALARDVALWKGKRFLWQRMLELLKPGERLSRGDLIDPTADPIEECKRHIAEMDALIARHPEAK